jgi:GTP cyclohydrolase II
LGSLKCDCGDQLHLALQKISENGGILIYLRQEGRDIGLLNKVNAYALQDRGFNTIEANLKLGFAEDERDFTIAKEILKEFKIKKLKLITNNPKKIESLNLDQNFEVLERVSVITKCNTHNENYISTKKENMGHLF